MIGLQYCYIVDSMVVVVLLVTGGASVSLDAVGASALTHARSASLFV